MLGWAADREPTGGPDHAVHGKVVGLGPSGGEYHLTRQASH